MSFQNLTLKRKLIGIIFLTSLFVLILTCLTLFYYEIHNYRQTTVRHLSTLADVITANSASVLIFDDQTLAQKILSGLRVEPEIVAAAFFDKSGKLYATYPTNADASEFPASLPSDGVHLQTTFLTLSRPIIQEQSRVGTLFLKGDLNLKRHLKIYGLVLLMILGASGIVALFLSNLFQRQISQPLLNLANTAKAISERKDYSVRATKTSDDELGDLTEAFNSMLNQIQKSHNETMAASRAKDDFLAALSHELRTPLNPVLLIAGDAATNEQVPKEIRADFEMIRRNIELEARLIDDLLDLTRITRGKLSLNMQLLDVHGVLEEAIATVRADAEKKHVQLSLDLHTNERIVYGDGVRLQQVFWNVLKNAVKFTPENGKIVAKTFTDSNFLIIKIIDTGIGIKPEELIRVFDAFSQGDHAEGGPHRFGGLGLGLAISKMLVELHSGSIQAASGGIGKGATFLIQLPLARPTKKSEISDGKDYSPILPPPLPEKNSQPICILLVEDHEPTRTVLSHLLARRHYEVIAAGSLAEARSFARQQKFQLLISDIGLPDGNGYDLMAELRSDGLKGIALTGYGMEQDVSRSHAAGFTMHLTKPVRMESLEEALVSIFENDGSK